MEHHAHPGAWEALQTVSLLAFRVVYAGGERRRSPLFSRPHP